MGSAYRLFTGQITMKRIGLDIRELQDGRYTGIGRYLRQLLSMVEQDSHSFEWYLYGNQSTRFSSIHPDIRVRILEERNTFYWDQVILPRALASDGVDVVVSPYFKAPWWSSSRLVLIVNDLIPLTVIGPHETPRQKLQRFYYRWGLGRSLNQACRVLTISQRTKSDLMTMFGTPKDKMDVWTLAVDPMFQKNQKDIELIRNRYKIKGRYILCNAHFKPHKNVEVLVRAYEQLSSVLKENVQLVLTARRDDQYLRIQQLVERLSLSSHVVFTGSVSESELVGLYSAADVFVYPSRYEGFGLPVIEAMSCGCPVVTTTSSALPEVAGDAALLFDSDDSKMLTGHLTTVLTDTDVSSELTAKGLQRAGYFSGSKMIEQFLQTLKDVSA
jgi:glycosyltransferase involved in cell wall biosynthesis